MRLKSAILDFLNLQEKRPVNYEPWVHVSYVKQGRKRMLFLNGKKFDRKGDCYLDFFTRSADLNKVAEE